MLKSSFYELHGLRMALNPKPDFLNVRAAIYVMLLRPLLLFLSSHNLGYHCSKGLLFTSE